MLARNIQVGSTFIYLCMLCYGMLTYLFNLVVKYIIYLKIDQPVESPDLLYYFYKF